MVCPGHVLEKDKDSGKVFRNLKFCRVGENSNYFCVENSFQKTQKLIELNEFLSQKPAISPIIVLLFSKMWIRNEMFWFLSQFLDYFAYSTLENIFSVRKVFKMNLMRVICYGLSPEKDT